MNKYDFTAAFIVPTGIGASIGGYAGDASPYVNLISKVCPIITNPNAVNGAIFSGINENILYTEGLTIDKFFKEEIGLRPSKFNKLGVIFDKSIPQEILNVHINTINAIKSVYGLNIIGYEITKNEVGVDFNIATSGISTGTISNPDTLIETGQNLLTRGVEAIAIVCYFGTSEDNNYANGQGVDPVGGVEAIISHILTNELNVPTAHAPAFNNLSIDSNIVDPRASAEYITTVFLPSVLLGLYNAPKPVFPKDLTCRDITLNNIKALIVPHDCLGSIPVLKAIEKGIPVITVEENKTVLNITAKELNIEDKVIKAKTYYEAAGILLAMKEGICIYT
jgi:hypothetical protein